MQNATWVNDVHSRLNATRVRSVARPGSTAEVRALVRGAAAEGRPVSVAGGRHAMGGQAFLSDEVLIDGRGLDRVIALDPERRTLRAGAGADWRAIVAATRSLSPPDLPLGIVQKQTGADDLTLGGSVAANAHGRGLSLPPLAADVESLELVDPDGDVCRIDRRSDPERFALVVGGYGLFGIVTEVELRLARRRKLRRRVELREAEGLVAAFDERIAAGALYGDYQPDIDPASPNFLRRGVFATYEPVDDSVALEARRVLAPDDWRGLLRLAHLDRTAAFERYAGHYLATNGQVYDSDTSQLSTYLPDYHRELDGALGCRGSEMITELYVPRARLELFLEDLRVVLRERRTEPIYATVRLIERDDTTVLAWAREPWACLVVNLHVEHTPAALAKARADFRAAIDVALGHAGSFFLTYHRWATARQIRAAHPRIDEFRAQKLRRDPARRFDSDWWRALEGTLEGRTAATRGRVA